MSSRIHECSKCGYFTTRLYNKQRHERRIHQKRINKKCCGESFSTKYKLYRHRTRCHPHMITRNSPINTCYKLASSRNKDRRALRELARENDQGTFTRSTRSMMISGDSQKENQTLQDGRVCSMKRENLTTNGETFPSQSSQSIATNGQIIVFLSSGGLEDDWKNSITQAQLSYLAEVEIF